MTGSCWAVSDIGPEPEHLESLATGRELIDDGIEPRVGGLTAGNLPQTTDYSRGGFVPVQMQSTFRRVQEQLAQQVVPGREVRRKHLRQRVRREAVQAPTRHEGRHGKLVEKAQHGVADILDAGMYRAVAARELMQMCTRRGIHA